MAAARSGRSRFIVVIPVYNHGRTVRSVVAAALKLKVPVIVVDDGSSDNGCGPLASMPGVQLISHEANRGKGAALLTGFRAAAGSADWAITMDADGQHHPADAQALIRAIPTGLRPIVVGHRRQMAEAGAPWTSRFGRGFSNFWIRMAGGPRVSDSQSGFRVYPLPETLQLEVRARRYQFEVEVLVKAGWSDMPVVEAPVRVVYQAENERVSHFRPLVDFLRNSCMFARLICQRLFGFKRLTGR
jgi:glycosyltransferase involved in cell wall biosynthesis